MAEPDHLASIRHVYDRTAADYAAAVGTAISAEFETPLDRAMLSGFALQMHESGGGRVVDVGCGVGRVTAYLADRNVDVSGVDLAPGMVAVARTAHPTLHFETGSLTDLPFDTRSLAGAVLWYSIIHTSRTELPDVWEELARVLAAPGNVLIAFQAGQNDELVRSDAHGTGATLRHYRHHLDDVATSLGDAGFDVTARWWREPELDHETTPQAGLLAHLAAS
jgi:ubiquinone/menaquinone biosynthesis C-methylase UbiE